MQEKKTRSVTEQIAAFLYRTAHSRCQKTRLSNAGKAAAARAHFEDCFCSRYEACGAVLWYGSLNLIHLVCRIRGSWQRWGTPHPPCTTVCVPCFPNALCGTGECVVECGCTMRVFLLPKLPTYTLHASPDSPRVRFPLFAQVVNTPRTW